MVTFQSNWWYRLASDLKSRVASEYQVKGVSLSSGIANHLALGLELDPRRSGLLDRGKTYW